MALIQQATNTTDPLSTTAGYDPSKITLDAEDTVEGRLARLTSSSSPLIKQATTDANQAMNSRGLINSSIAVGAAQDAVIKNALPIAQADAAASLAVKQTNVAAENAVQMQKLIGSQNLAQIDAQTVSTLKVNQQQIDAQTDRDILMHQQAMEEAKNNGDITAARDAQLQVYNLQSMKQQQQNQLDVLTITQQYQKEISALQFDQQKQLAQITQQNAQALQSSAAAVNLYGQTMQNIMTIGSDPNTTAAQKQAGVNQAMQLLKSGLELTGTDFGDITIMSSGGTAAVATAPAAANKAQIDDLTAQYRAEAAKPRRNELRLVQLARKIRDLGGKV